MLTIFVCLPCFALSAFCDCVFLACFIFGLINDASISEPAGSGGGIVGFLEGVY